MLSKLKNHPFAVEAFFESSLVLTFSVPKEQLTELIPECLELDTFNDQFGFIAIAMVQTKGLRPKGIPKIFGNDFFLIGYRVFVRYTTSKGKRLRGLYILKSETDKKRMEIFGNIFTHYNYTTTAIHQKYSGNEIRVSSKTSQFSLSAVKGLDAKLPENSPFSDWKEARRYAGPLPFTFTYNTEKKEVLIIEGVRENWKPEPINISDYSFAFLDQLKLENIVLANAFIVENIPYYWKKGRRDQWKFAENPLKG